MADNDWDSVTRIGSKARGPGSGGVGHTRVLKRNSDINAAKRSGAPVSTEKKHASANTKSGADAQLLAKIANSDDIVKPTKVGVKVGEAIRMRRDNMEPAMTQKDLAGKVNSHVKVIQAYETGSAPPDQNLLIKLERVLGVKLRGDGIGKPLDGPKKK